jgi:hypothetical protein
MAIEQPVYTILVKDEAFEVRWYPPMIIALAEENDLRGYSGFSRIFEYISGNNAKQEKIAMTSPVINTLDEHAMTTAFVMPKAYDLSTLPQPQSGRLALVEKPSRTLAALRFSGHVNARIIAQKTSELQVWIRDHGYTAIGSIELARYNPPFIPGFLKRNEVWQAIESPQNNGSD